MANRVEYDEASWDKAFGPEWAMPLLDDVIGAYAALADWTADSLKATLEDVMQRYELKLGKAQAPVRVAVTGRSVGPPLFESLEVLGRDETLRRLTAAESARRTVSAVAGREFEIPSDEERARDREILEALDERQSVGERYARDGEVPISTEREPTMRPDPQAGIVRDPTPVRPLPQPPRSVARRVLQVVALCAMALLAYGLFSYWQVWSTGRSDEARPVDAIVVLGAAQYDGRPSPQLAARLDHALTLWPEGLAPMIVVTGGNQPGDRFTEADASAAYLAERGVPTDAIVLEGAGRVDLRVDEERGRAARWHGRLGADRHRSVSRAPQPDDRR